MEALSEGIVFRLAVLANDFPADAPNLSVAHLRPSTKDLERAKETGRPLLISVFEATQTTFEQALVIRNMPTPAAAFEWEVPRVLAIGNETWPRVFRIFRDALLPPANSLAGADGHCGIEGLHEPDRPNGMTVKDFKEFRAKLAKLSRPLQQR